MDRIVEGTYTSTDEAVKAVERLLNEGYVAEELLIITDEKHEDELEKLTLVDVESVEDDEEEESLWDKIKETFRMGDYSKENESNTLVEHGVDAETAEHFSESLENHEIIILMNSTAPEYSNHLSTVNEEVLNTDDSILETNDSKNALSEEQVKPSEIKTKESMNPASGDGEPFDPSKSQSAREDVPGTSTISSPDRGNANDEEMFKKERAETTGFTDENESEDNGKDMFNQDRHDAPHLTGDEKTVNAEDSNHVYPDNISTGVVGDELDGDASLDKETRKVEHPDPHKDIPESDAYYSNKYEDAGGKTIRDEEER